MNWLKDRIKERTTLDGIVLITVCMSVLFFGGIVEILAKAGLVYGIYTTITRG